MILIADSGSTKTDWHLVDRGGSIASFRTVGLNPYFVRTDEVIHVLQQDILPSLRDKQVEAIRFYGAGCSSAAKQAVIREALEALFPTTHIAVEHDLLAAARALFGRQEGIACILGTGSNSCVYDGENITESLFSLGYMFGDEGSGAHLGKTYIAEHLKDRVPHEIGEAFTRQYGLSKEDILTHVYKKPEPNRFLASFTHFLRLHVEHPYIRSLVSGCFDAFFREQISRYTHTRDKTLGCIGSVAYHFSELFMESSRKHGLRTGQFLISPMEGLIRFHSETP